MQATNIGQIAQQIQRDLKNIKVNVPVGISPADVAKLQALSTQAGQLQKNMGQMASSSSAAAISVGKLGQTLNATRASAAAMSSSMGGTASSLHNVNRSVADLTGTMDKFSSAAGLSARRFLAFSLSAGGIIALSSAIRTGISQAALFGREMNRISQVSDDTKTQIAGVERTISGLAKGLGVSSQDLAKSAVVFRQAGQSISEVSKNLETLAQAALAPNFDSLAQTTEGIIAVMSQFKLSADQTRSAIGSMNAVAAEFAVEGGDLISAVRKAGGAFKQTGGDLNQFIALFTSVRQTTRESADEIASGLRTIFTRVQRKETVEQLKELQINLRYTRKEAEAAGDLGLTNQFVGAYEAVKRLSEGLAGLRPTDSRYAQVIEQLGGYRQVSRVIPLITEFSVAQKALNVAQAGSVSLSIAAEKAQESLIVRVTKLKEEYLELGRAVVDSEGFQAFSGFLISAASAASKLLNALTPLIPLLGTFASVKLGQGLFNGAAGAFTRSFLQKNSGGVIPGSGNGDTVPSMLTPGEFVMTKTATQRLGISTLRALNSGAAQGFARGGLVGYAAGGLVSDTVRNQIGDPNAIAALEIEAKKLGVTVQSMAQVVTKFNETIGAVEYSIGKSKAYKTEGASRSAVTDQRLTSLSPEQNALVNKVFATNEKLITTIASKSSIGGKDFDSAFSAGQVGLLNLLTQKAHAGQLTGEEASVPGASAAIARAIEDARKKTSRRPQKQFGTTSSGRASESLIPSRDTGIDIDALDASLAQPTLSSLLANTGGASNAVLSAGAGDAEKRRSLLGRRPGKTILAHEFVKPLAPAAGPYGPFPLYGPPAPPVVVSSAGAARANQLLLGYEGRRRLEYDPNAPNSTRKFTRGDYSVGPIPADPYYRLQPSHPALPIIPGVRGYGLAREASEAARLSRANQPFGAQNGPFGSVIHDDYSIRASDAEPYGPFPLYGPQAPPPGLRERLGRFGRVARVAAYRGLRGIGGRIGGAAAGVVNGGIRLAGSYALPLAASYGGELLSSQGGTAESAVSGRSESSFAGYRAAGSGLSGAAIGGSLGFAVGGPIGAAVGAAGVGIFAFASALRDAEKEIRQVRISSALSEFADKIQTLANNGGASDYSTSGSALKSLTIRNRESFAKNSEEASGFFGGLNIEKFQGLQSTSLKHEFGNQLPQIAGALSKQAESLGRAKPNGDIAKLADDLRNGGDGLNRELLSITANVRGISIDKVLSEFSKNIEAGQKALVGEQRGFAARQSQERSFNSFERLSLSVESAAQTFRTLQTATESLNDLFHGTVSAYKVSLHGENLNQLGRNDQGALQPLRAIASAGGAGGRRLLHSGIAVDAVSRILPGILSEINAGSHTAGEDVPTSVSSALRKRLGGVGGADAVIDTVVHELGKLGDKVYEELKVDPAKISEKLIEPFASPVKDAGQRISKILEDSANSFTQGLATLSQHRAAIGETGDVLSRARLGTTRLATGFVAQNLGNSGRALDLLSLAQLNQPFNDRQSRLAGSAGLSPGAIGAQLSQTNRRIAAQTRTVENSQGRPEFNAAAVELNNLKTRASELQQALKHLTDTSERSAGAQEKYARLQDEKGSRRGLAERYLTADPAQKAELQYGFALAARAQSQGGSLSGNTAVQNQKLFAYLSSAGNSTLNLPGGPRANDLLNSILDKNGGGLRPEQKKEESELQRIMVQQAKDAETAIEKLKENQEQISTDFFTQLGDNQSQFLAKLHAELDKDTQTDIGNKIAGNRGELSGLGTAFQGRQALAGIGVQNSAQLEALTGRKKDIEDLANSKSTIAGQQNLFGKIRDDLGRAGALTDVGLSGIKVSGGEGDGTRRFISQDTLAGITDERGKLSSFLSQHGLDAAQTKRVTSTFAEGLAGADAYQLDQASPAKRNAAFGGALQKAIQRELTGGGEGTIFGDAVSKGNEARERIASIKGVNTNNLVANPQPVLDAIEAFSKAKETGVSLENLDQQIRNVNDQFATLNKQLEAAKGGRLGFADGGMAPRGTDTVPAMLSPGEFIVNSKSAQANLGLLHAINSGTNYLAGGGEAHSDVFNRIFGRGAYAEPKKTDPVEEARKKAEDRDNIRASRIQARRDRDQDRRNGHEGKSIEFYVARRAAGHITRADIAAARNNAGYQHTLAGAHNLQLRQLAASSVDPGAAFGRGRADYSSQAHGLVSSLRSQQAGNDKNIKLDPLVQDYLRFQNNGRHAASAPRRPVLHLAQGGVVGYASGGSVGGSSDNMIAAASRLDSVAASLSQSFTSFAGNATALSEAINSMPRTITHTGHQTVEVLVNGAQALSGINDGIRAMIEEQVNTTLSSLLRTHFPDAGVPAA